MMEKKIVDSLHSVSLLSRRIKEQIVTSNHGKRGDVDGNEVS